MSPMVKSRLVWGVCAPALSAACCCSLVRSRARLLPVSRTLVFCWSGSSCCCWVDGCSSGLVCCDEEAEARENACGRVQRCLEARGLGGAGGWGEGGRQEERRSSLFVLATPRRLLSTRPDPTRAAQLRLVIVKRPVIHFSPVSLRQELLIDRSKSLSSPPSSPPPSRGTRRARARAPATTLAPSCCCVIARRASTRRAHSHTLATSSSHRVAPCRSRAYLSVSLLHPTTTTEQNARDRARADSGPPSSASRRSTTERRERAPRRSPDVARPSFALSQERRRQWWRARQERRRRAHISAHARVRGRRRRRRRLARESSSFLIERESVPEHERARRGRRRRRQRR